jgi:mannose-1-phosphate guanylyltransferase
MKALLLAAGFGTRLGDLTKDTPKPLVKVGNEPMLAFCIDQLWKSGVTEVVINTHYLSEKIEKFIDEFDTPMKVFLSYEEKLLGTAGTVRKHIDFLSDDDFLVMHSDNFFSDTLLKFVKEHKARKVGSFGTLGTFKTHQPESCGVLVLNPDKTIKEFHEKVSNPPTNLANAAIYVFTPKIREPLFQLAEDENDISRNLIPKLMSGLYTQNFEGLFVDIGTPEGLKLANSYKSESSRSSTE